ncbi:MAG: DUF192 domain-containing protein [Nanoarchaeota archaeon]|nr:DUF192 domain-containing protein [Nanoarchaeota archaeon]
MAKLIHKGKIILPHMKYATGTFEISTGLMLASEKKVKKGICLVMPSLGNVKFGSSVTMLFCIHDLEIIFVDTNFKVVDKKILKTWTPSYTPKAAAKYVIEAQVGDLKDIKVGDSIEIIK